MKRHLMHAVIITSLLAMMVSLPITSLYAADMKEMKGAGTMMEKDQMTSDKGEMMVQEGKMMIEKGNTMKSEGQMMIDKGEGMVKEGQMMMEKDKMMK